MKNKKIPKIREKIVAPSLKVEHSKLNRLKCQKFHQKPATILSRVNLTQIIQLFSSNYHRDIFHKFTPPLTTLHKNHDDGISHKFASDI
jgi:hypothetical protein